VASSTVSKTRRPRLSHIDAKGRARMVDVGEKAVTRREAIARCEVHMRPATLALILKGKIAKGEVLSVARIAGIMAAKRTSEIIPMCHPLALEVVSVDLRPKKRNVLEIEATVRVSGKTGVEMEALTAVTAAALTVYDMCKAVDRGMVIADVSLVEKSGGRSGTWRRARR
jgi:cyclic pyranopterin phosphate synthase